jgi:cell division protein FtsZ
MNAATEENMVSRVVSSLYADALEPTTCVIGCGGAGCNIVSSIHENGTEGIRTIAMNVDEGALERTQAETKICLNRKREPKPGTLDFYDDYGWMCDAASLEAMEAVKSGILFLVSGMGGRTGTTLAPAIAKAAKEKDIVTIAVAITPFSEEGRSDVAEQGVKKLSEYAECVITLENDSLKEVGMDMPFNQAVDVMNAMVVKIVESVQHWISRSFLATIAEEVDAATKEMFGHHEIGDIQIGVTPPVGTVETHVDPIAMESDGRILRK